jgi:membrane protein
MEKSEVPPPEAAREHNRGRHADAPTEVPPKGWLDILTRTKNQVAEDNLSIVAAGVAFYGFVAVVPALAALIALYGLISDPVRVAEHITALAQVIPQEVMPLLEEQMTRIASNEQAAGFSLIIGLGLAFYSASRATIALITGLNIAYDETEKRNFIKLNLVALALTGFAIVGALIAVGLVAVLPSILERLPISGSAETLLNWLRWPVLLGGFMIALTVIYRYAPSRNEPQWRWVSWGAGLATGLWLIGSAAFSFYVSRFGSYDKTYGSLGAIVVFLLWLFLSAFVVLIGAELNSEMERQTLKDTTIAPEEPLGQRGAQAADTVGPSRRQGAKEKPAEKPQKVG